MAKGFFYKIISEIKEEYGYKIQLDIPEVSHNIPEGMIIDVKDLHCNTRTYNGYFSRTYMYMKRSVFDEVVASKIIWPTEYEYCGGEKLGAAIIRCETGDIIAFFSEDTKTDDIYIRPAFKFDTKSSSYYETCRNRLPKRNIKVFMTKEEFEDDKNEKLAKSKAKREENHKKSDEVKAGAPTFSLKTPKFKLIKIVKKTDWIPNIKEDDILYGEIPVIENKNGLPFGMLHGGMSYSNYVNVYVNDKLVRQISPLIFQDLFLNNYKVEEV